MQWFSTVYGTISAKDGFACWVEAAMIGCGKTDHSHFMLNFPAFEVRLKPSI
jgi:hypothetical protein